MSTGQKAMQVFNRGQFFKLLKKFARHWLFLIKEPDEEFTDESLEDNPSDKDEEDVDDDDSDDSDATDVQEIRGEMIALPPKKRSHSKVNL
jgi:hypothetical protein